MDLMDGFIGATLGGLIGGVGSYVAIRAQLASERTLRNNETRKKVKAIKAALYHEIDVVWQEYMLGVGRLLEGMQDGTPFTYTLSTTASRYVIYDQNAQHIGLIDDFSERNAIVTAYTRLKALADAYQANNLFIDKVDEAGSQNTATHNSYPGVARLVVMRGNVLVFQRCSGLMT